MASPYQLDWNLLRSFLAVAEQGSLSAAGRETGLSQPTIGRHIAELEAATGLTLFTRHTRGLTLSEEGETLIEPARAMREAAARLSLAAEGRAGQLDGTVRITASIVISQYVLPWVFAQIRRMEPRIALDLVPSDSTENLLFREADIAVRMYRPEQLDVITTHVGDVELGLFASRDYLAGRSDAQDILEHDWIGLDRSDELVEGMRAMGFGVTREFFRIRCDNHAAIWELIRAGCGIGVGQVALGARDPSLVRLAPEAPLPVLPIWLTAPAALRTTPRIRRIYDLLAEALGDYCAGRAPA